MLDSNQTSVTFNQAAKLSHDGPIHNIFNNRRKLLMDAADNKSQNSNQTAMMLKDSNFSSEVEPMRSPANFTSVFTFGGGAAAP